MLPKLRRKRSRFCVPVLDNRDAAFRDNADVGRLCFGLENVAPLLSDGETGELSVVREVVEFKEFSLHPPVHLSQTDTEGGKSGGKSRFSGDVELDVVSITVKTL